MRLPLVVALAAAAIAAAVAIVLVQGGREEAADNAPMSASEQPLAVPAAARTVVVSRAMPMPSPGEGRLSAMLEAGRMPDRSTMAEVMTDSECTPDAHMISRCRNVVRLASGRDIVLRHPHDMSAVPCLAPGERVLLVPAGA